MRLLITLLAVTLVLSGCGGSDEDAGSLTEPTASGATTEPGRSEQDAGETLVDTLSVETDAEDSGGFTGVFADTYEAARQICRGSGVVAIAEEFGSAPEPDAAARAYASNLANEGSQHHDASYLGCLEGLREQG
jgi:uncharacterized lipoprotein NlpE involved in copper resistance